MRHKQGKFGMMSFEALDSLFGSIGLGASMLGAGSPTEEDHGKAGVGP